MIKIPNLCEGFKSWLVARRFKRLTRDLDQAIADARRSHKPTAHLLKAKSNRVHLAIARAVWP